MLKYRVACILVLFIICIISPAFSQQKYPLKITVSQDGRADYSTIQDAINSVRDLGNERVTIFVRNGIYTEKLIVPGWKTNISIIGETMDSTIITGNDYSGKQMPGGKSNGLTKYTTYTSFTVLVDGNGTVLENLTIENTAGAVGQAVALHANADRLTVRNCRILGNQDTLYTSKENNRQYYDHCFVSGTTDFIFGEATCVFSACTIESLANSYITAAAQREGQRFGYVFINCKLVAAKGVDKVFLGRPWRPYAKTVFINTEMGAHILPEGWFHWPGDSMFPEKEKTALYGEYGSTGKGGDASRRISWSRKLSKNEIKNYALKNIFKIDGEWDLF